MKLSFISTWLLIGLGAFSATGPFFVKSMGYTIPGTEGELDYPITIGEAEPVDLDAAFASGGLEWLTPPPAPAPTTPTTPTTTTTTGDVLGDSVVYDGPSPEDILNEGYDSYIGTLDQMLNENLPGQQTALTTQANADTASQQTDLDTQLSTGQNTLNQYQGRTLRDLSGNIRNMLNAGNIFLGARGAGDSSATNMYSHALNKFGTQQRTNVMQDVSTRLGNLKNIYNSETNKLKTNLQGKIGEIAQWFYTQQQTLLGMKADAAKERSSELLNIALQNLSFIQNQVAGQQSALDQWVVNNANSLQEATKGLQQNQKNMFTPKPTPGISMGQLASYNPYFGSTVSEEDNNLFG